MKFSSGTSIGIEYLVSTVNYARQAELTRDLTIMRETFSEIWEDIEKEPDFDAFSFPYRADLYRFAGFFLSHYGKMKSLKDYQERGKNLLTRAIDLFEDNGFSDKANEARIMLALSYYYEGAIEESTVCLNQIIECYSENPQHPIFLQAIINKSFVLAWQEKHEYAEMLLENILQAIEISENHHLLSMYHNHAGMVSRRLKKFAKGAYHYQEAIRYSKLNFNSFFLAANHNNLANLYRQAGKFADAHEHIEKAIAIFAEEKVEGGLAQCFDTKANIYYEEQKNRDALRLINEALEIFMRGEDFVVYVESLMTKVKCLLRLRYKSQAIYEFIHLSKIAAEKISEDTLRRYTHEFESFFYIKRGLSLTEEIKNFKKEEVSYAILEAGKNLSKAARILKLKSHQHLDQILESMPELCDKHNLPRRQPNKKRKSEKSKEIKHIPMSGMKLNFDDLFYPIGTDSQIYYFSKFVMESISEKYNFDALVVTRQIEFIDVGQLALTKRQYDSSFHLGTIKFESEFDFYSLHVKDNPVPFILRDLLIIGEPVGFCSMDESIDLDEIIFRPFE